jgi:hypothetical protein
LLEEGHYLDRGSGSGSGSVGSYATQLASLLKIQNALLRWPTATSSLPDHLLFPSPPPPLTSTSSLTSWVVQNLRGRLGGFEDDEDDDHDGLDRGLIVLEWLDMVVFCMVMYRSSEARGLVGNSIPCFVCGVINHSGFFSSSFL